MAKSSGGGGNGGRTGGGGGSPADPGQQMLDNLRSGKLSQKDAEAAADGLLTASMKSRNFDETRAINKKYAAAMDAIDAYKAERGTFKPIVEKTSGQVAYERYQNRRKYEGSR
jgi:hypothetical protein